MLGNTCLKWDYQIEEIFDVYLVAKNEIHPYMSYQNTTSFKTITTFYLKDKLFWKPEPYGLGHNKNVIDKKRQMAWSQFSIKILGVHFGNSVVDNSSWNKINDRLKAHS